jgi:hypothetical protein
LAVFVAECQGMMVIGRVVEQFPDRRLRLSSE